MFIITVLALSARPGYFRGEGNHLKGRGEMLDARCRVLYVFGATWPKMSLDSRGLGV